MTTKRALAPAFLLLAAAVAACGTTSTGGSPAASTPASVAPSDDSAVPSASASADASASAGASASADASASASADTGGAGGGDLVSRIPATVGDVAMSATEVDADAYITANVNRQLTPLLTALGKTSADVTVATATGSTTGGATLFLDAVQIAGTDAEGLLEAFSTAAAAVPGQEIETTDVGGKSVAKVTTTSYTLAVYATGDTLFYVQSPDAALVDEAIGALE
jgi:hypothetical protein